MASAAFTVNGSTPTGAVAVGASTTVTLALLSTSGVNSVAWSIVGNHSSGAVDPTITPAGSPVGATASFPMPAGAGQAYLVQCVVNGGVDANGDADSALTKRHIVGVNDAFARVPLVTGEKLERSATHGWTEHINDLATNFSGSSAAIAPCRLAATANIANLSNAGANMDGAALVVADRVLLPLQTTATQNGVYVVSSLTPTVLTRATDMALGASVNAGITVAVQAGTAWQGSTWTLLGDGALTVGTDELRLLSDVTEIDPRRFGVLADGVTDDTAAWWRALDALGAAGGGKVLVPRGVSRVMLDLDGTLGDNFGSITFVGQSGGRSGTFPVSVLKAITKAQNGGVDEPEFVVRSASGHVRWTDVGFDGDYRTPVVFHYDYISFQSGMDGCYICRALDYAPVTVTADAGTNTFTSVAHGLVDGDWVRFQSTVSLPANMGSPVEGTNSWVWVVLNATADTFQVERYVGEGAWDLQSAGAGTITCQKYGGTLLRIGGVSEIQADTGFIRNTTLMHEPTGGATRQCGRAIHMSDANALIWEFGNCHIQGATDLVWIKGAAAVFRNCSLFPTAVWSRAHFVKEGEASTVVVTDGTYSETDAVAMVVLIDPAADDSSLPWVFDACNWNTVRGVINWDCRQPLVLRGVLPGDVRITATGGHHVTAIGTSFNDGQVFDPQFRGDLHRLVAVNHTDLAFGDSTTARRIDGPRANPNTGAGHGYGLWLSGGAPSDSAIRKAGPVVVDLGNVLTGVDGFNRAGAFILGTRAASVVIESVDTGTDLLTITGHGFGLNTSVRFATTDTLPTGLRKNFDYWVVPDSADEFGVSLTWNGPLVNITGAGTGTHTVLPLAPLLACDYDRNDPGVTDRVLLESSLPIHIQSPGASLVSGDGPPDGVVDGTRGMLYVDTGTLADAGEATLWVAEQASGNTGWAPVNGDWEHREPTGTPNTLAGWDNAGDPAVLSEVSIEAGTSYTLSELWRSANDTPHDFAIASVAAGQHGYYDITVWVTGAVPTTGASVLICKRLAVEVANDGSCTARVDNVTVGDQYDGITVGGLALTFAGTPAALVATVTGKAATAIEWSLKADVLTHLFPHEA